MCIICMCLRLVTLFIATRSTRIILTRLLENNQIRAMGLKLIIVVYYIVLLIGKLTCSVAKQISRIFVVI